MPSPLTTLSSASLIRKRRLHAIIVTMPRRFSRKGVSGIFFLLKLGRRDGGRLALMPRFASADNGPTLSAAADHAMARRCWII